MKGIWAFDARIAKELRLLKLNDFANVREAISSLEKSQTHVINVIPYVAGLSCEETMGLSVQEFDERRGCLVIVDDYSLENKRATFYSAEKMELVHEHALRVARKSMLGLKSASFLSDPRVRPMRDDQ